MRARQNPSRAQAKTKKKARAKTAFVPRSVFLTASLVGVGVIPMCVQACGGATAGSGQQDSGPQFSVAAICYQNCEAGLGVADSSFSVAADAFGPDVFGVADASFPTVAQIGFDAEAGSGDAGVADVIFSVAADAFGGG